MNSSFRIALFIIPCSLFLFFISVPHARAEIVRTLKLGSAGSDVKELQILLNSNKDTEIAPSGVGSPGNESEYFGLLTKKAVEAFQKKYAPEVLFPAGIWEPTGVVGFYSRQKLNSLSKLKNETEKSISDIELPPEAKTAIPNPSAIKTSGSASSENPSLLSLFVTKSKPLLFNVSKYQAKRGESVTVQGNGFLASGNSIVFDSQNRIDGITSVSGTSVTFVIPASLPNGSYNLSVENKNGSTYSSSFGNFFTVTDSPSVPPKVFSISPQAIPYSRESTLTILGEGFTATGNDVFVDFGTASNIASSDGKTLNLKLSAFTGFSEAGSQAGVFSKAKVSIPVFVVVKNSSGISSARVSFLLQY